jgi:Uma2 family endonuclease
MQDETRTAERFPATTTEQPPDPAVPRPPVNLQSEDGEPLESAWHRAAMNLLIESVSYHFRDRSDFFVGGNMFLHFSDKKVWTRDFRGPDFFYVRGVDRHRPRDYYATWEEDGQLPHVIVELSSPSTLRVDRTIKRELYQNILRTPEYFLYDPTTKQFEGLRLTGLRYEPIEVANNGRLWSSELELWLGPWHGEYLGDVATWPRFFDSKGHLVLRQAEAEFERAEDGRRRAEIAEAEVVRLRSELDALRGGSPPQP